MALPDKVDNSMVKKILSEINMTEHDLEEAVVTMKQWLSKSPHLPKAAAEDSLLKAFIIGCKSVERAKKKLDLYFTFRSLFRDPCFLNRDPAAIEWHKATEKIIVLPGMTVEGYKVCYFWFPKADQLDDYDVNEVTRVFIMVCDMICKKYHMCAGLVTLCDMANMSVELTLKCSFSMSSAVNKILVEGYPFRMKTIISFNVAPLAETFFNTFMKPFLSEKLKSRVYLFSEDHKSIDKFIPIEMLPSDYEGGQNLSIDALWEDTKKMLESERNWFLNEGSQTVNEDLRPAEDKDEMKGTFRKLQVE